MSRGSIFLFKIIKLLQLSNFISCLYENTFFLEVEVPGRHKCFLARKVDLI